MEISIAIDERAGGPGAQAGESAGAAAADLRHQFRNEIQMMTSLVGLFGDRMEPGPARAAFVDLRARFQAAAVMHCDEFVSGDQIRCDALLASLARRIAALYDTPGRMKLDIKTTSFTADQKRAATIAQLFAEMLVDFFGRSAGEPDSATIAIDGGPGGALRLSVYGPTQAAERVDGVAVLGRTIMGSLAHSLGASVTRGASGGYTIEATAAGRS